MLLLPCLSAAHADILYDNGGPNQYSGTAISNNGRGNFTTANDFRLTSAATLDSFTFWSLEPLTGGFSGTLTYAIYTDNTGTPGTLLTSVTTDSVARTPLGASIYGYDEFKNDVTMTPIHLAVGTYWLAMHDSNDDVVYWESTDSTNFTGAGVRVDNNGGGFELAGGEVAFHVDGTIATSSAVPEAGTAALLGLALPIIGAVPLRRRTVK